MNLIIWTGSVISVEPQNTVEPQNKLHLVKGQEDTQDLAFSPAHCSNFTNTTRRFLSSLLAVINHQFVTGSMWSASVEVVELNVVSVISPVFYCFHLDGCYVLCYRSLYVCQHVDLFHVPFNKW